MGKSDTHTISPYCLPPSANESANAPPHSIGTYKLQWAGRAKLCQWHRTPEQVGSLPNVSRNSQKSSWPLGGDDGVIISVRPSVASAPNRTSSIPVLFLSGHCLASPVLPHPCLDAPQINLSRIQQKSKGNARILYALYNWLNNNETLCVALDAKRPK